jgi:hypothetical protein
MSLSFSRFAARSRGFVATVIAVGVVTAGAGGAATIHRFAIAQSTGSEGATAVVQTSASGSAIQGEVAASANTTLKIPFGVLGEYDAAGTKFGIGLVGLSTTGYGIGAEAFGSSPTIIALAQGNGHGIESYTSTSSDSSAYGIYTEAQGQGDGIDGIADNGGWGGYFSTEGGIGIEGDSSGTTGDYNSASVIATQYGNGPAGYFSSFSSDGIKAFALSGSGIGVDAYNSIGSEGILGDFSGEGVVGFGKSGNAHAAISAVDAVGGTTLLEAFAYDGGNISQTFFVSGGTANRSGNASATYSTDVQMSGDLYVYGNVFQNCGSFPASSTTSCEPVSAGASTTGASVARSSTGNTVAMYGARQSLPTVEDEGTAQLVNGRALVRIDPAFAQTMDMSRPYRVFVTPDGPSRGVYVANRTQQGFEVDENPGGRSTVAFEYRIVGAPFGDRSARLAIVSKKIAQPSVADPRFASLRKQVAKLRAFDLNHNHAQAEHVLQRHLRQKAPASFTSFAGFPKR